MMQFPNGLRAFLAASFAAFVAEMKPHVVSSAPVTTGFKPFDNLTRSQQFVTLHELATSLLQKQALPLKQAAYRQATLLALFDSIERNVRLEILENNTTFRSLILAAHKSLYGNIRHGLTPECTDIVPWNAIVKSIRKILVNEELLEVSQGIIDLPPELTESYLRMLGIERDFYIALPDDPAFFQTVLLVEEIYVLCTECLNHYLKETLMPIYSIN